MCGGGVELTGGFLWLGVAGRRRASCGGGTKMVKGVALGKGGSTMGHGDCLWFQHGGEKTVESLRLVVAGGSVRQACACGCLHGGEEGYGERDVRLLFPCVKGEALDVCYNPRSWLKMINTCLRML